MKILVTGGAGFIGSAFVRLAVQRGLPVVVVDKLTYAGDPGRIEEVSQSIQFHRVDIAEEAPLEEVFRREKPRVVVHFAAETHVDRSIISPRDFVLSNFSGTANLLSLSLKYGADKFIQISTDEVYGELAVQEGGVFREGDCLLPNSPYSATKAGSDMLVRAYHRTYGLPAVIVRPSNNYGPWQYPEKLLPLTIAKIFLGERIPVYGRGENVRTWLFVDDCVAGISELIERGEAGEIYNIGSSEERRNIEVVRSILALLGRDDSLIEFVADRPGHDFRYAVDTTKISARTGWKPSLSFERGLERTVQWYSDNREWLLRKKREVEEFVRLMRTRYEEMQR